MKPPRHRPPDDGDAYDRLAICDTHGKESADWRPVMPMVLAHKRLRIRDGDGHER